MSNIFTELDALIEATDSRLLQPHELLELQSRIAAHRYRLSEVVSQLSKTAMLKETDRKALVAKAKLTAKAESIGTRPLSNDAAVDKAEQLPEVIRARAEEIMAAAEHESAKMKLFASGDVLSSLTMRISYLRDERKMTAQVQQP